MLLARLRRSARGLAILLLLASTPAWPHLDQDDLACAPVAADRHDESKHAIDGWVASTHTHCAICHWARTLRRPAAPAQVQAPLLVGATLAGRTTLSRRPPALDQLPARAPPASRL